MNDIDKKLYSIISLDKVYPSQKYQNFLQSVLNDLPEKYISKNKFSKFKVILASACCSVFLITGIVFAKDMKNFFQDFFINNKGIFSAIENDFVENNNSTFLESNNIKTYIDSILMDDYKLCINLAFELLDDFQGKNITSIQIPNLLIYDENENILFNQFYEDIDYSFFNISNLNNFGNFWPYANSISVNKENNTYFLTYQIDSPNFPKSKNITIMFNKINLLDENIVKEMPFEEIAKLSPRERLSKSTVQSINGNWKLNYNLSEKTYERENYVYKVKNANEYNFNFPKEILVSNTETKFDFEYDLSNIVEGKNISNKESPYIKTDNGEILKITNSEQEYSNNIMKYHFSFELSIYNSTETMYLIIPTESGTNIKLILEKK